MLTIAQDLEVEELRKTCEEHVTSTLSILNACTFLAAGLEIQDRLAGETHSSVNLYGVKN